MCGGEGDIGKVILGADERVQRKEDVGNEEQSQKKEREVVVQGVIFRVDEKTRATRELVRIPVYNRAAYMFILTH